MIQFSIILLAALGAANAAEPDTAARKTSSIGYASVAEALSDLKANPENSVRVQEGWTIIDDRKNSAIWSFSPEGHPAYPAAVKRTILERDGHIYVDMKALCQAKKEPCDELIEQFKALNEQIRQHMQQQAGG